MSNHGNIVSLALAMMIITEGACFQYPPLGGAINVLNGYGHLDQSIKVMPTKRSEQGIYGEPIVDVFTIPSAYLSLTADVRTVVVMANVRKVYCPNINALIAEYFHRFHFEGINRTARVFNSGWSLAEIAGHFGINEAFVGNGHCYMFLQVTLSKTLRTMFIPPDFCDIDELVADYANSVIVNDTDSAEKFISNVGTHYISSFVTGDSLYQVFVQDGESCHQQKASEQIWEQVQAAPSLPDTSVHVGKIRAASGNPRVEEWAAENLGSPSRAFGSVPTLEILRMNDTLNKQLDQVLQDDALLGMRLKTLAPVFKNLVTRKWFAEYIRQQLEVSAASLSNNPLVL